MSIEHMRDVPFDYDLPRSYESDNGFLLSVGVESTFQFLAAKEWIGSFCAYNATGALNIEATCQQTGIPIAFVSGDEIPSSGATRGMLKREAGQQTTIYIRKDSHPGTSTTTQVYGHELGHIFLEQQEQGFHDRDIANFLRYRQSRGKLQPHNSLEDFCEYFSRQTALPIDRLSSVREVSKELIMTLAEHYDVQYGDVVLQLMEARKLPRKVYVHTKAYANESHVQRLAICIDCVYGVAHDNSNQEPTSIPMFDFTDHDMWYGAGNPHEECAGRDWSTWTTTHRSLNISLGKWSESDEEAWKKDVEAHKQFIEDWAYPTGL